jgi:hypothetical protein
VSPSIRYEFPACYKLKLLGLVLAFLFYLSLLLLQNKLERLFTTNFSLKFENEIGNLK